MLVIKTVHCFALLFRCFALENLYLYFYISVYDIFWTSNISESYSYSGYFLLKNIFIFI